MNLQENNLEELAMSLNPGGGTLGDGETGGENGDGDGDTKRKSFFLM